MALCEKILIAGFSGAGKSTLLRALKASAPDGWESFEDLDHLILKKRGKEHKNLAALIDEVGWEKFRLWERQELEGWLKEEGKGVLALGGGTLTPLLWELYGQSRKIRTFFLDTPFEICWDRLSLDKENPRPLLLKGKNALREIYDERVKIFNQIPSRLAGEASVSELAQAVWKSADPETFKHTQGR